jgi:hypothetical protein
MIKRMKAYNIDYETLNDDPMMYGFLIRPWCLFLSLILFNLSADYTDCTEMKVIVCFLLFI